MKFSAILIMCVLVCAAFLSVGDTAAVRSDEVDELTPEDAVPENDEEL